MKKYLLGLLLLLCVVSPAWATKTQDTFVDAGAPICLAAHTPTGGGAWALAGGTACVAGSAGTQINASGHLRAFTAADSRFTASDTATNDQIITITVGANPPDGWFFTARSAGTGSSESGIAFDLVCGTISYLGDMSGSSYGGSFVASSSSVTCSAGDVFKLIVSGTSAQVQKCPGGTSCTLIAGLSWTTVSYTTGKHVSFTSRSALTDALTSWISDDYSSNTLSISEPDGLTGTGWHRTKQIIPTDVGHNYATVTIPGGYTGTAGTNVDLQFCSDSACSSIVQSYTTCTTSATIGGGTWSCPMQVPATWSASALLHIMARWTNITSETTPAATTATLGVGISLALLGQSQAEHMWTFSSQVVDCHTTNTSATVTSAVLGQQSIATNYMTGWPITGTNIPGGDTITSPYNAGTGSVTITPSVATGTTTAGTCNYEVTPGSANGVSMRYQGGTLRSVLGVATPPQVGEGDYSDNNLTAPNGNPEGAIELATNLSSLSGGGAMEVQYALTGTSICAWISTNSCTGQTNSSYSDFTSSSGIQSVGQDFNAVLWSQGGTDALDMVASVSAVANNGSGKFRLTLSTVGNAGTALWQTGDTATVSGITGTGVPGCLNTAQTITVIDATHIDLPGCSFSGSGFSGGRTTDFGTSVYSTYLQNVETWVHTYRASAPFMIMPLGTFNGDSDQDYFQAVQAIRLAHLAEIDAGRAVWGGGEIECEHQDEYHASPSCHVKLGKRIPQALAKASGASTSGYGPKIASATWDGNVTVTVTVTQEGAATLTCGALSTSCGAVTGFRVFGNGSAATISATAFGQPNKIILTLSSKPTAPVTLDYQAGQNPVVTNAVYDNQAPFSDTQGMPLQPSRGTLTALNPSGFFLSPPFGIAANDNKPAVQKRVAGR